MSNIEHATIPGREFSNASEQFNGETSMNCDYLLEIRLIGQLEIRFRGRKLTLPTRHAGFLIALLSLEGSLQRESAAARLWGEREDAQARASLRQTIYHVQKAFALAGAPALVADRQTIGLKEGTFRTDVSRLFALLESDPPTAAKQFNGELFGDVGRIDPAFQEWLDEERRAMAGRIVKSTESASAGCFIKKDWNGLEALASVRMKNDPYNEDALRHRMEALVRTGRRASALSLFEEFKRTLRSALQVNPEIKTVELRDRIANWRADDEYWYGSHSEISNEPGCQGSQGVTLLAVTQTVFIQHPIGNVQNSSKLRALLEEIIQHGSASLHQQADASIINVREVREQG